MMKDEIVDEVRATRKKIEEEMKTEEEFFQQYLELQQQYRDRRL